MFWSAEADEHAKAKQGGLTERTDARNSTQGLRES